MYRTFVRSARNWKEFAEAEKIEEDTGLTFAQARAACGKFNAARSEAEIEAGTKMEFEKE